MIYATPTKEHEWLRRLVGEWTYEYQDPTDCDGEPIRSTGSESVRLLGGAWLILESLGTTHTGAESRTMMTLGFDPGRGRYVGTFVTSQMTYLWVYDGVLSDDGTRLELTCEGPSFHEEGTMTTYVDTVEFVSPDERLFLSRVRKPDGAWEEIMRLVYHRVA